MNLRLLLQRRLPSSLVEPGEDNHQCLFPFCIFITFHFFNFSQETERGGVSALGSRIGRAYYKVDRSTVGSLIVNLLFICGVFALTARYLYILSFVPKPGGR